MRIGGLAAATGITTKTIRFYEQAGLLPDPPRTSAGYRDYPAEAPARLAFIRAAQSAGLTLAEIRSVLAVRENGRPPCTHVTTLLHEHLTEVERRLTELTETRQTLHDLLAAAETTDPDTCTDGICTIFDPSDR
jgi:MerR family transcriptional regulator, copper efflux regulator